MRKLFIIILINVSCSSSNSRKNEIIKLNLKNIFKIEMKKKNNFIDLSKIDFINSSKYNISTEYFPSIAYNERIRFLILHYTALDYLTSVEVLTKKNVSSHYLIPDDESKNINLLVSENKRAWHAGVSRWGKFASLNDNSIGIEIVNKGFVINDEKKEFFDYTEIQYKKIADLCKNIIVKYNIKPNYILGHSDIAPQRKNDPGPKFPWKRLYEEHQIGAWYNDSDKEYFLNIIKSDFTFFDAEQIKKIQQEFYKYGYEISVNGIIDKKFKKIVTVFQHHFRPGNYDGNIDEETYAIILALNKKYKNN